MIQKLIEQKRKLKSKKPNFIKQDAHKKKRLDKNWRRPRGIDSKIRLSFRGYRRKVKVGYGTPGVLRNKDSQGRTVKIIRNLQDLEKSEAGEALVMSSGVGIRKRAAIIEKALKLKQSFVNLDVNTYLEEMKKKFEKRKAERIKLQQSKDKKQKTAEEKKPKTIEEKVELSDDEKKKLEKEEKDKVLRQGI